MPVMITAQLTLYSKKMSVVRRLSGCAPAMMRVAFRAPQHHAKMWWGAADVRRFSDASSSRPNAPTPPAWGAKNGTGSDNLKEPAFVRGLEQKAMEELDDLHVDTVDDDEEMILVDGKHTFSWQVRFLVGVPGEHEGLKYALVSSSSEAAA
jgi:hypothetical protein